MIDTTSIVLEALERIKSRIAESIDEHGLTASGKTAASMHIVEKKGGAMLVGRPYFQGLEIGRPAGNVPVNFREIIEQWIKDKGIRIDPIPYKTDGPHMYTPEERGIRAAASAIAHTIHVIGTRQHRNGTILDVYTTIIDEEVERLKSEVSAGVVRYIENEYDLKTGLRK